MKLNYPIGVVISIATAVATWLAYQALLAYFRQNETYGPDLAQREPLFAALGYAAAIVAFGMTLTYMVMRVKQRRERERRTS